MAKVIDKKVTMTLAGVDGNAFSLVGAFTREAKRQGWTKDEVEAVKSECFSGDYDHLLQTLMDHIEEG